MFNAIECDNYNKFFHYYNTITEPENIIKSIVDNDAYEIFKKINIANIHCNLNDIFTYIVINNKIEFCKILMAKDCLTLHDFDKLLNIIATDASYAFKLNLFLTTNFTQRILDNIIKVFIDQENLINILLQNKKNINSLLRSALENNHNQLFDTIIKKYPDVSFDVPFLYNNVNFLNKHIISFMETKVNFINTNKTHIYLIFCNSAIKIGDIDLFIKYRPYSVHNAIVDIAIKHAKFKMFNYLMRNGHTINHITLQTLRNYVKIDTQILLYIIEHRNFHSYHVMKLAIRHNSISLLHYLKKKNYNLIRKDFFRLAINARAVNIILFLYFQSPKKNNKLIESLKAYQKEPIREIIDNYILKQLYIRTSALHTKTSKFNDVFYKSYYCEPKLLKIIGSFI